LPKREVTVWKIGEGKVRSKPLQSIGPRTVTCWEKSEVGPHTEMRGSHTVTSWKIEWVRTLYWDKRVTYRHELKNKVRLDFVLRREGHTPSQAEKGMRLDLVLRREGVTPSQFEKKSEVGSCTEMRGLHTFTTWKKSEVGPCTETRGSHTATIWKKSEVGPCTEMRESHTATIWKKREVSPCTETKGSHTVTIWKRMKSDLRLSREGLLKNVRSRSCIERIMNLHWRYKSCIERITTPNIRLTVNQLATPNNMRPGSCIERITVSSLETLYREGLFWRRFEESLDQSWGGGPCSKKIKICFINLEEKVFVWKMFWEKDLTNPEERVIIWEKGLTNSEERVVIWEKRFEICRRIHYKKSCMRWHFFFYTTSIRNATLHMCGVSAYRHRSGHHNI